MKAEWLNPGRPVSCEPLTCTRDLCDIPIANRPLGDLQRERMEKAGLILETNLRDGVFVDGSAWLSDADLAELAARPGAWTLRDADGCALAWSGPRGGNGTGAPEVVSGPDSFHIRYPWDLLRVNERVLAGVTASRIDGSVYAGAHVEGVLVLGPRSRLLPGVFVEGVVVAGADCKIGPNCYLRGSTSIGDHCHIGQSVELKNSIVMNGTNIGHLSYCGDSILGEKVNFGAGTMCANLRHDGTSHRSSVGGVLVDTGRRKLGAIVGDGVHTGINTSIYPGRKLWPGLFTRPGAIVQKDLMPEDPENPA